MCVVTTNEQLQSISTKSLLTLKQGKNLQLSADSLSLSMKYLVTRAWTRDPHKHEP